MFGCLRQRTATISIRFAQTETVCMSRRLLGDARASPKVNQDGKFWKITLHRSPLGLPPKTRKNVEALGLRRRGRFVYHPISNELAGMILKLKEIVKLEIVDKVEPYRVKSNDGFEVVGRHNPQIAPGSKAARPLNPLHIGKTPKVTA